MVSAQTKQRKAERDAERAESEVRIAWDRLDIMTSIEIAEMEDSAGEVQILAQALAQGIATAEMVQELRELRKPERAKQQLEHRMEYFAKYVEHVPRDWFVENAPDELDFADPATYKFLKTRKFGELSQMLAFGAAQQDAAAKN